MRVLNAVVAALAAAVLCVPAQASSVLVINGSGGSSVGPQISAAGFTVINETYGPGAISSHLSVPNDITQIWIWNDGTFGNTGTAAIPALAFSAADEAALVAFNAAHSNWIMDGLSWRSHGSADEQNFTRNEALNLEAAGGGIVLGADDASGAAIVQHVNQVAGLFNFDPWFGVYSTSPLSQVTGGTFFTTPNAVNPTGIVGTTTYSEVPNGLQPNGIFLGTAIFGQGFPHPGFGSPPLPGQVFDGVFYPNVNHLVTTNIFGATIDPIPPGVPEPGILVLIAVAYFALRRRR